jgi:hypothetical protein
LQNKQGINPAQRRQLDRIKWAQESATTFEAVVKEWVALKDWMDTTKTRRLDMLARDVFFRRLGPYRSGPLLLRMCSMC